MNQAEGTYQDTSTPVSPEAQESALDALMRRAREEGEKARAEIERGETRTQSWDNRPRLNAADFWDHTSETLMTIEYVTLVLQPPARDDGSARSPYIELQLRSKGPQNEGHGLRHRSYLSTRSLPFTARILQELTDSPLDLVTLEGLAPLVGVDCIIATKPDRDPRYPNCRWINRANGRPLKQGEIKL